MTRALVLLPAAFALGLAAVGGSDLVLLGAAALLYGASILLGDRNAAFALLAAPLVLGAAGDAPTILGARAAVWLFAGVLAVLPFFVRIAGAAPWKRAAIVWVLAPLMLVPVLLMRWAPTLVASDVSTRTQVALLAVATLLVASAMEALAQRRAHDAA